MAAAVAVAPSRSVVRLATSRGGPHNQCTVAQLPSRLQRRTGTHQVLHVLHALHIAHVLHLLHLRLLHLLGGVLRVPCRFVPHSRGGRVGSGRFGVK